MTKDDATSKVVELAVVRLVRNTLWEIYTNLLRFALTNTLWEIYTNLLGFALTNILWEPTLATLYYVPGDKAAGGGGAEDEIVALTCLSIISTTVHVAA